MHYINRAYTLRYNSLSTCSTSEVVLSKLVASPLYGHSTFNALVCVCPHSKTPSVCVAATYVTSLGEPVCVYSLLYVNGKQMRPFVCKACASCRVFIVGCSKMVGIWRYSCQKTATDHVPLHTLTLRAILSRF